MVVLDSVVTDNDLYIAELERQNKNMAYKLTALTEEMHNLRNTKKTTLIATNNKQAERIKELARQLQEVEARLNTWNIMAK